MMTFYFTVNHLMSEYSVLFFIKVYIFHISTVKVLLINKFLEKIHQLNDF